MAKLTEADKKVIQRLIDEARSVIKHINEGRNPDVKIPLRALSNVYFDEKAGVIKMGDKEQERTFFNVGQAKKFLQTFVLAAAVKELVESGKTTSIRDLFYMCKRPIAGTSQNVFDEQEESDPIIEDVEVMIDALREELHLFASSKGAMVGNATIVDGGDTIDLRKMGTGGWAVPSIVEKGIIEFKKCEAEYVLLVEKDAVWRRLNEDKFWQKNNCIIIHGGGVPPRGVRRLMRRMNEELKLPAYVLVDNDPWGLYIYSVVKQGSINLAYESMRMAVPSAKFIGLSSFDAEKYKLPKEVELKLTAEDTRRCKEILGYPWFQKKRWQEEIKHMMEKNRKLELEAISRKGISFISEKYIPDKIKNKDWME